MSYSGLVYIDRDGIVVRDGREEFEGYINIQVRGLIGSSQFWVKPEHVRALIDGLENYECVKAVP